MPITAYRTTINCKTGEEVTEAYEIPDPTPEEIAAAEAANTLRAQKELESELENHIDRVAQSYTWRDITSAIAASSRPGPFQANAIALADWWESCWMKAHEIQAESRAIGVVPTVDAFLSAMPPLVLT